MLKPNTYKALQRAVEDGASYAWHSRIFKYEENPSDESAIETITQCIMNEICDWFDFEEKDESTTL
jgi:hypothetical protein